MQPLGNLLFLVLLFVVFYFMLIRPQKKRAEQHRMLIESLGVGDDIVTIGGLFGTIRALREDHLEVEVASGVTIRVLRSAVARKITEDEDEDEEMGDEELEDEEVVDEARA